LDGNGYSLQRDNLSLSCTPFNTSDNNIDEFRLMRISSNGTLDLKNTTLAGGCAAGDGGAILNQGRLIIDNSIIQDNKIQSGAGGAGIANLSWSEIISITNSTLTLNSGATNSQGGGLFFDNSHVEIILNSILSGNSAGIEGGGIHLQNGSSITEIINSSFNDNDANDGGAFFLNDSSTISSIRNSVFSNNTSNYGAGIYIRGSSIIEEINNTTFSTNITTQNGGAIFIDNSATIQQLTNISLIDNEATNGGGIFVNTSGMLSQLSNSLFSNNSSSSGSGDCDIQNPITTAKNNISDKINSACTGMIAATLNPLTVNSLANNGCTTFLADGSCAMTHALLNGSEAIDQAVSGLYTDQRGFDVIGLRDIGAFELSLSQLQLENFCLDNSFDVNGFNQSISTANQLRLAIQCANVNSTQDTINLSNDITLTQFYEDDSTYGRTGTPVITSSIVINGMGNTLQRDANLECGTDNINGAPEFRLLRIADNSENGDLDLINITLVGGCVYEETSVSTKFYGGAILNEGKLNVTSTDIENNQANVGAGIMNLGIIGEIINSTFVNNTGQAGGGLSNANMATIGAIKNSIFLNNASSEGAGIGNYFGSTISLIENSSFEENVASSGGGGITNWNSTIVNIKNSTFLLNSSPNAGGILNNEGSNIFTITNSTFSNNVANYGGAIMNFNSTINTVQNSTFSTNTANVNGSGIYNNSIMAVENSLFHNNELNACYNANGTFDGINNLSDDPASTCPGLVATTLTTATVDSLADNGCTTPLADGTCVMTHALLASSEAIDIGDDQALVADQRGFIAEGIRDIGSYEFNASTSDIIFKNGFEE